MIELTKGSSDLRGVRFCITALSKNSDFRPVLQYLHIKDGVVTSTDGHRIHQYTLTSEDMPDGLYEVGKNTKGRVLIVLVEDRELSEYPDFEYVFPTGKAEQEMGVTIGSDYVSTSGPFCKLIHSVEGLALNFKYFMDLGIDEERDFTVKVYAIDSPVMFEREGMKAGIVPMRI